MGRVTYEEMAAHWPTSTEEVARIKGEPGGGVIAYGGFSPAQSLSRQNLVDEYRLVTRPVALGSGEPMLNDLPVGRTPELVESTPYLDGTVVTVYRTPS